MRPWYYWANDPLHCLPPEELGAILRWLPKTPGIGGHTTRPWLDYGGVLGRQPRYLTFLRDPVQRYLSHLNYQRLRMGVPWTLESFLGEPRFANYQTTRLAGGPDLDLARRFLEGPLAFVGLTERFDESLILLRRWLGADDRCFQYERYTGIHEEACPRIRHADLGEEMLERVRSVNRLDLALYEHAKQDCFSRQLSEYGGDLGEELAQFRERNRSFRYSGWRRFIRARHEQLFRVGLEPTLHRRFGVARPGMETHDSHGSGTHSAANPDPAVR
ncbi:MAG: hypothetical protein CME06_16315 [Gemmatimonadetes bacterium]|nr:hypothetical protein [Gemmatimonadota bacterium]